MAAATTSTISVVPSIPVFTASQPRSATTASICATTNAAGAPARRCTATVFWAVSAVIAEVP